MIIPPHLAHLPAPSPDAQALSDQLSAVIAGEIIAAGGGISYARYMELALYAPGLGYYSAGSRKLGEGGAVSQGNWRNCMVKGCITCWKSVRAAARWRRIC